MIEEIECAECGIVSAQSACCPVCGTHHTSPLDPIVKATTACGDWANMKRSMRRGYVPTIYPHTRRKRILLRAVRAAGFRAYDGNKVR